MRTVSHWAGIYATRSRLTYTLPTGSSSIANAAAMRRGRSLIR